ncbi:MAG: carboxypeptidase-like regulatory domain-containing protein [Candidatus Aminicenantes bacterium]|nr:carboxypeptidase-like regulatory domain-containing protein [Candidatus Aminicenantes bacterium]
MKKKIKESVGSNGNVNPVSIIITSIASVATIVGVYLAFFHPWSKTVQGRIIDELTKDKIVGATIIIGNNVKTTDSDGKYVFRKIKPGFHKIKAMQQGYETFITNIEVTDDIEQDIKMKSILQSPRKNVLEPISQIKKSDNVIGKIKRAIVITRIESTHPDYVVIKNITEKLIDIGGYTIAEGNDEFMFPDNTILKPDQAISVLFFGKKNAHEIGKYKKKGQLVSTAFGIKRGETITLLNKGRETIDIKQAR